MQAVIVNICDVSYGGENGFNQAIELSTDILANVKFIQEKKLIAKCVPTRLDTRSCPHPLTHLLPSLVRYFDEISQDTGKFCFGVEDTLQCLDMGAVETLIVWENLEINRHVLMNTATSETLIKYLTPEQEKDTSHFVDKDTGAHLHASCGTFRDWLALTAPSTRSRRGAGGAGEDLVAGMVCERVQALRLPARVRDKQVAGRVPVLQGVRRHWRHSAIPGGPAPV